MKQRHSYHRLWYHLVFHIKNREHLLESREDERFLFSLMKGKAHELDAYIEELGAWRDHVHVLLRSAPTLALSDLYRQLKGLSAAQWRKRFPERPFKWGDGAYSCTVDPENCDRLRSYIADQWRRHEERQLLPEYEREGD
jgi:putative transposase